VKIDLAEVMQGAKIEDIKNRIRWIMVDEAPKILNGL